MGHEIDWSKFPKPWDRIGPSIQDECTAHGPVSVGEAAITGAGALRARYVIHAASMSLGGRTTAQSLRSSMEATFRIARDHDVKTIAVPAVGTGIAGFSLEECASILLEEAIRNLKKETSLEKIYFVLFDDRPCDVFTRAWKRLQMSVSAAG